jgi:hypothetical protein
MKIDKILSGIRQSQDTTKEASEHAASPASKTASSSDALVGALNAALTAAPAVKTASEASSPVADVMKVAAEIAAVEQGAQVKQAQVMGAAFADAFVARLGVWQTKAAELNQSAPAQAAAPTNFAKVASENPGLIAQAQNMGYAETKEALEKEAEAQRVQGFNDTTAAIHKTASIEFLKGAAVMSNVLDAVAG